MMQPTPNMIFCVSVKQDVKKFASVECLPPLFQAHGAKDPLVLPQWGAATHKALRQAGVNGLYTVFPNLFHEVNMRELEALTNWVWRMLPEELPKSSP